MDKYDIAGWTEKSWNPSTGCTKISSGCLNCYAEKKAIEFQNKPDPGKYINGFDLTLHEDVLEKPYHWKTPKRVFVNSMSDLFHENMPVEFILEVFKVMRDNPQHLYIVLTKRADVLERLSPQLPWHDRIWMGVTVEEAKYNWRIDCLRNTKARHKFISAEPLLGDLGDVNLSNIDWLFVGGESGPNCRPMEESWVINLKEQCDIQDTMFSFKQWGGVYRRKNGSVLQGKHHHSLPATNLNYELNFE